MSRHVRSMVAARRVVLGSALSALVACAADPTTTPSVAAGALEATASTTACADDVVDPNAAPGALEVYFSMPELASPDFDCRAVTTNPPAGRLLLGFWQMGPAAANTPVSWDVGSTTGFYPDVGSGASLWQRGPNDERWTTAAQMRGRTIGMWINAGSANVPFTGEILPVVAHYDFPTTNGRVLPKPFLTADSELSYAFDAQVPAASAWGGGVPYAAAVFRFKDENPGAEGRQIWFSMVIFDPRGIPDDSIMIDGCSTCSQYPILMSSFQPARRFGSMAPGSAAASSATWSGFRHFDFRISPQSLRTAIDETKEKYKLDDTQLSPNVAQYSLLHVNLNPEVHAPPGGGGSIGMSAKNITAARYRRDVRPFDRVVINAANGSNVSSLQVFFKTSESNFYDERKSARVPFPLGGGNHDVVADFSAHPDFRGRLTGLRIDPFDSSASNACFNVDRVTLTDSRDKAGLSWTFDGPSVAPAAPFFGWHFFGLERLWSDGRYWGACSLATSGDPYFFTELDFDIGR